MNGGDAGDDVFTRRLTAGHVVVTDVVRVEAPAAAAAAAITIVADLAVPHVGFLVSKEHDEAFRMGCVSVCEQALGARWDVMLLLEVRQSNLVLGTRVP